MAVPLSGQRFVVKASDQTKPWRSGKYGDVLPFLVALENLPRRRGQLLIDTAVLLNAPHATLCLCHIWYVKARPALRHNVWHQARAACGASACMSQLGRLSSQVVLQGRLQPNETVLRDLD